jgi:putative membrane protein
MTDLLATAYLWIKAIHIMAVITWMAGIFYLPRLFVYHAEQAKPGDARDQVFQVMEYKLFRYIMRPSMMVVWAFGLALVMVPGLVDWASVWPWVKLLSVLGMTWFHIWCGKHVRFFSQSGATLTGRQYRMMNEVPTVLMIAIVFAVVLKF